MLGGHGLSRYPLKLFMRSYYYRVGFRRVRVIIPWDCLLSKGCWHQDQHGQQSSRNQAGYPPQQKDASQALPPLPLVASRSHRRRLSSIALLMSGKREDVKRAAPRVPLFTELLRGAFL